MRFVKRKVLQKEVIDYNITYIWNCGNSKYDKCINVRQNLSYTWVTYDPKPLVEK